MTWTSAVVRPGVLVATLRLPIALAVAVLLFSPTPFLRALPAEALTARICAVT